jgi:ribosome biogenesis GTPase
MNYNQLTQIGWNSRLNQLTENYDMEQYIPARVIEVNRDMLRLHTGTEEVPGYSAGKLYFEAEGSAGLPVTGDWVLIRLTDDRKGVVHHILERRNILSRKASGRETLRQPMASNIDYLFIVQGLDNDFNLRRLERYLALALSSDIAPVVIFNKSDLAESTDDIVDRVREVSGAHPVHFISALESRGLSCFSEYLRTGITGAFLGSSGAGKSTIINSLLGRGAQRVSHVREDDSRGRHTTTSRQLFMLPDAGMVIDTPGMRELEPWAAGDEVASLFMEIQILADQCRFKDCTHNGEPGCMVSQAIKNGDISHQRLQSFQKLIREQEYQLSRVDEGAAIDRRRKEKQFAKECRKIISDKNRKKGR